MIRKEPGRPDRKILNTNLTIAILVGQVGFLTLFIVLAAVLGGLWLDNRFQTRPIITIVLLVVSIPISVTVMLGVVRSAVARIKVEGRKGNRNQSEEEPGVGRNQNT
ncbi:MAG: AtpZ/AtpI family protein [Anaerolineaceae bacterium]|nr:AtpZ/AtpI family protein [Anaerolineaceae bacterium]